MESELIKSRSFSSCIKAAFTTYCTNANTILRNTWLAALVNALVVGFVISAKNILPAQLLLLQIAASLLTIFTSTWLYGSLFNMLNANGLRTNLQRVFYVTLSVSAISIILGFLLGFVAITAVNTAGALPAVLAVLAMYAIIMAFLLPVCYSGIKYIMEKDTRLIDVFGKQYVVGLKSWGYLFMIVLLVGIVYAIVAIPVFSPVGSLMLAAANNSQGIAMGDPSGLPALFELRLFITASLSAFVLSYVFIWGTLAAYYAYGAIEKKNRDRQNKITQAQE
ncbi:MAG: hypothetical protein ACI3ZB_07285 [Prevotella sp.]